MTLVNAYSGPGRYFIAIKRNETAPTNGPTSIGVHFRLPVAHAELPLRFARLGAASKVTFSVFLFRDRDLGSGCTLRNDHARRTERQAHPAPGLRCRSRSRFDAQRRNAVSVLEGSWRTLRTRFPTYQPGGADSAFGMRSITRLATILSRESLEEDAHFTQTFVGDVPRERFVSANVDVGKASAAAVWLMLLLRRPKRRRVAQRPI